jgi:PilZ domain
MNPKQSTFSDPTFGPSERRGRIRFRIALGVRYAAAGRQEIEGTGKTVNISSCGVLITSAHELSPGTSIGVVIEWPVLIDNNCPLALHAKGRVVRSSYGVVAVQFSTHEFRTRLIPPNQAPSPSRGQVRKGGYGAWNARERARKNKRS